AAPDRGVLPGALGAPPGVRHDVPGDGGMPSVAGERHRTRDDGRSRHRGRAELQAPPELPACQHVGYQEGRARHAEPSEQVTRRRRLRELLRKQVTGRELRQRILERGYLVPDLEVDDGRIRSPEELAAAGDPEFVAP